MISKYSRISSHFVAAFLLVALSLGLLPGMTSPALAVESGRRTAAFARIELIPNIETVGVVVSGTNLPRTAMLMYQRSGETDWRAGHPLLLSNNSRLVGSLFSLSPATAYNIKVVDGTAEISGSITTQPDELQFTPAAIVYVDDDASAGGDGTRARPFKTIQEGVNHAAAGTQVLVADGIYHEAVTFPASGADGQWIQVKAEGSGAILDGSQTISGDVWKVYKKGKIWYTGALNVKYLARDGQRYYRYDKLKGLVDGRGHNNVPMSEGWYMATNSKRLYVRSADDPSKHTWQVPYLNHAFDVASRNWIWIEGFEMRYYGMSDGCGVCAKNASHLVIRRNKIHNMQLGIFINWSGSEEQGNDTRIEYNDISDPPVNEWPWNAVKGSTMEGTAIVLRGHVGEIVRGNELHHFFNGIYTGSSAASALENPAVALDVDIYDNRIHHISDDAFEPEGACVNHRFHDNLVDTTLVGVSLAPVTQGPVWVVRSVFANFTGTSFKWDRYSDGIVLIYHNTSWTNARDLNAMSMIRPAHNASMRNNIFQGNGYAFEEPFTGSTGHSWDYDNWYTTRGSGGPHFKWEKVPYNTIAELCAATNLECNGHESPPGMSNPGGGDASDFSLFTSGALTGASVTNVSGADNIYNVSVNTGSEDGSLSLNLEDDDSILDAAGNSLGGAGPGNGSFTSGEQYTVIRSAANILTATFASNKTNDGWVIELNENSNQGNGVNSNSATFYVGDNAEDRQFRAILDFNTSSLPDNAVIFKATLKIKKLSVTGTDPFSTHQNLLVDIRSGAFGASALQVADFQSTSSLDSAGTVLNAPVDNWFSAILIDPALPFISRTGPTQFRLRFQIDDNDDLGADTIKFYSGDTAIIDNRPLLLVEYYLP
jgi:hypothetical protein